MRAFEFQRASNASEALKAGARFLAGGTTLVDLMRLEVETPDKLVDVKRLPFSKVEVAGDEIRVGASVTNSALAKHPLITENLPALAEAVLSGASPQLRNLATTAGNLLQRTRCGYFRDLSQACNKRVPGSGCGAWDGYSRMHAILGGSEHCIAAHPSDMCVALAAFGARIVTQGASGESREIAFDQFYLKPLKRPDRENTLKLGELITHVLIPKKPWFKKSLYLKARDRASYAFALASVALALDIEGGKIREARVAFGGVGTVPWRSPEAETALNGKKLDPVIALKAAEIAFADAHSREHNAFKVPLAKRLLVQALRDLGGRKMIELIGKPLTRLDGPVKVKGEALYAGDWSLPNLAHGAIFESTIPAGKVLKINSDAALKVPGVIAVLSHENAPKLKNPGASGMGESFIPLQDSSVFYNGQFLGVVIAETLEAAQEGAKAIRIQYKEKKALLDFEGRLDESYAKKVANGVQLINRKKGNPEQALKDSASVIKAKYETPREQHNPMEPSATVASFGAEGLLVYDSTQAVADTAGGLAKAFGLKPEKVQLITKFLGGGFGCKGSIWPHQFLAVMAAKLAGRPVKITTTRQQMFTGVGYRAPTIQHYDLGVSGEGKLKAMRHKAWNLTAVNKDYPEPTGVSVPFLYETETFEAHHRLVPVNHQSPTFMRAPGEASGSFGMDSAMDEMAHELGMDPLAFYLLNYSEKDGHRAYTSKSLRQCYEQGAEKFGWKNRATKPGSRLEGDWLIGYGMATATYPCLTFPSQATVELLPDGTVKVRSATQDLGTGTYTVMTQVAATELGLEIEQVDFDCGDSRYPHASVSGGSSSASSVGSAVKLACEKVKGQLLSIAGKDKKSKLHGFKPAELELVRGEVRFREKPSVKESYGELVSRNGKGPLKGEGKIGMQPLKALLYSAHAFGAHFAEVRVSRVTGEVRVARQLGAFACGRILNEKTARSQYMGGMIFGLGAALMEKAELDPRSGRVITADLADYHVPIQKDVGSIELILVPEEDLHVNPLGTKGIGEVGAVGSSAAIANAVFNATGIRVRELPITPDKLLAELPVFWE